MATVSFELPDGLDAWVERQAQRAGYADVKAYMVELVRRDRQLTEHMQQLITEGLESGISDRGIDEILAEARSHYS